VRVRQTSPRPRVIRVESDGLFQNLDRLVRIRPGSAVVKIHALQKKAVGFFVFRSACRRRGTARWRGESRQYKVAYLARYGVLYRKNVVRRFFAFVGIFDLPGFDI
jgi:hypothetical protein